MVTPRLPWTALLVAGLSACGDPPSVFLSLEHPQQGEEQEAIRQYRVTPVVSGSRLASKTFPELAGDPLATSETVRLVFDRSLAGKEMGFDVEGLSGPKTLAIGRGAATLASGELALTIGVAPCPCSEVETCTLDGCKCGGLRCQPGQVCLEAGGGGGPTCQCTAGSCPDGCCDGSGYCHPEQTPEYCGPPGDRCQTCDEGVACTSHQCANCVCPSGCCRGSECVAEPDAQSCGAHGGPCVDCPGTGFGDACGDDGTCTCGGGPGCEAGARCEAGTCVCNETSCPSGCCAAQGCVPHSLAACATAGQACVACDPVLADTCAADGTCRCGTGLACPAGQRCEGGQCLCDAASCPDGCCGAQGCVPRSADDCGAPGQACVACDPDLADGCDALGACACGSHPTCAAGQKCAGGNCVCDPATCAGCCAANACESGTSSAACGKDGSDCKACDPASADRCTSGACSCGATAACTPGTTCAGGVCACDAASCPSGCCGPTGCVMASREQCGTGGEVCVECDLRSDECTASGECGCYGGPPCAPGLRCAGAAGCVCDLASCPTGCCSAGACVTATGLAACGTAGGECQACDARADGCTGGACTCAGLAACAAGQRCTASGCVCDAASCPGGCCSGDVCTPLSTGSCAAPGAACTDCGSRADGCSASGSCRCGGGPACGADQLCSSGACVCDLATCDGCCSGADCLPGDAPAACGATGSLCKVCDPTLSSLCSAGTCSCGVKVCVAGQACIGNACECDPSCTGCCNAAKVCTERSASACGPAGGTCVSCGDQGDGCSGSGGCTCGGGPACGTGLRCSGGACVCDSASGCAGCCDANACVPGDTALACGTGSATCQACVAPAASQCYLNGCRCGIGPPCPVGQTCDGNGCRCGIGPPCPVGQTCDGSGCS